MVQRLQFQPESFELIPKTIFKQRATYVNDGWWVQLPMDDVSSAIHLNVKSLFYCIRVAGPFDPALCDIEIRLMCFQNLEPFQTAIDKILVFCILFVSSTTHRAALDEAENTII